MRDEAALLESLVPDVRLRAQYLLGWLRWYGLPARLISARRSVAHQLALLRAGRTTAGLGSRHLYGRAFDIDFSRPVADTPPEWWQFAGWLGQYLGLRWGGHFTKPDVVHFDL